MTNLCAKDHNRTKMTSFSALFSAQFRAMLSARYGAAHFAMFLLVFGIVFTPSSAQAQNLQYSQGTTDQSARSSSRVDPSTLGMSIQIPLGGYAGRAGTSLPITLYYSSKVWRMESTQSYKIMCDGEGSSWTTMSEARYGEFSRAGWTSSLGFPIIEWPKPKDVYDYEGKPVCADCYPGNYWVLDRLFLHMPSGSTHELRRDEAQDTPHQNGINKSGKFYSVDSSRLIYDADQKILYLPNGSRFEGVDETPTTAAKLIDANGNTLNYDGYKEQWMDTLGRQITAPPMKTSPQDAMYALPGVNSPYIFRWRALQDVLTDANRPLRYTGDVAKGEPGAPCGPELSPSLFGGFVHAPRELFNPVVLYEIQFPNGSTYRFTYNEYGEIDKIILPTGGGEQFEYDVVSTIDANTNTQTNRGVKKHWVRPTGVDAGEQPWTYATTIVSFPNPPYYFYKMTATAPNGTYAERYLFNGLPLPDRRSGQRIARFGLNDARNGSVYDQRIYSAAGQMLSRKLTEFTYSSRIISATPPHPGLSRYYVTETRDPKQVKGVEIIFDPITGSALSSIATYRYGQTSQPLNLTSKTLYGFSSIDLYTAQNSPVESFTPDPALALRTTETTYLENADYTATIRNLVALPKTNTVRTGGPGGAVVAQSVLEYDQADYSPMTYSTVTNWIDPGTKARGNVTTSKTLKDTATNSFIVSHIRYDQCGSIREVTDARGNIARIYYDDAFSDGALRNTFAYPTSTTSPVPDPTAQQGSNVAFTSSTIYDYATGLVLSATDANNQTTSFRYKDEQNNPDPLNRLRKVTRPDGGWTKYEYGDTVGNHYVMTETQQDATEKVKLYYAATASQQTTRTVKSYQYFDALGRPSRSFEKVNGTDYLASDTKYDLMGRVCAVSNPYRTQNIGPVVADADNCNPASNWTTTIYDELGRVKQATLPDMTTVQTKYQGIYTTGTDQAGKQRRQKVDALGRIVRVDEPDTNGNLGSIDTPAQATYYDYDILGNVIHVTQGTSANTQHRYFKYDALSRLTYERQVEQQAVFTASDPLTGNSQWSRRIVYDENGYEGLVTSHYDARNVRTTYSYDNLNRVTQIGYNDNVTPGVSYFYDAVRFTNSQDERSVYNLGKLAEVKTAALGSLPSASQAYNYDLMGRVANNRQTVGANSYTMLYRYNLGGALKSEQYPSGRVVSYAYDDAARLSSLASGSTTYASQFVYGSQGLLSSFVLGNGAVESSNYNSRLQIKELSLSKNNAVLQRYEYKYGAVQSDGTVDEMKNNGQIGRIEGFIGTQKQWQQRFDYDSIGRLSSADEYRGDNSQLSYQINYDYDLFGNRYQYQARNSQNMLGFVAVEANQINKLTNRFTSGVTYDDAGNIKQDQKFRGKQYQYDANNRQRQVSNLDGTGAFVCVYDGAGQRVATMMNNAVDNILVYDAGGKLIAEYGQTPVNRGTQYVFTDHQGSTRVVSDISGSVTSRHDYQPFGEEIYAGVGMRSTSQGYGQADGTRQKYAGMEKDDGSGMSHTLWRKYDSLSGRWTSPDPYGGSMSIVDPQSFNRYTYVQNDPVNKVDPLGLMLWDIGVYQTENPAVANALERKMIDLFRTAVAPRPSGGGAATLGIGAGRAAHGSSRAHGQEKPKPSKTPQPPTTTPAPTHPSGSSSPGPVPQPPPEPIQPPEDPFVTWLADTCLPCMQKVFMEENNKIIPDTTKEVIDGAVGTGLGFAGLLTAKDSTSVTLSLAGLGYNSYAYNRDIGELEARRDNEIYRRWSTDCGLVQSVVRQYPSIPGWSTPLIMLIRPGDVRDANRNR